MDLFNAFRSDGVEPRRVRIDGGMVQNDWFCQFLSDVTELVLERPKVTETTALGAAYLAGLAVGVWKNKAEISKQWKAARRFKPSMKPATRKTLVSGWNNALSRTQC